MESPFTEVEKRFVLAEMIKASDLDVGLLVNFVKQHDVQADWMLMQLPSGRNMNQCLRAAEAMFNLTIPPPAISPLKRKSFSELSDHIPKKQAIGSPGEGSPYAIPRNPNTQSPGLGQPVNIQPRPNGFPPHTLTPGTAITPISQNVVLPPRRRGRPPKAETLARQGVQQPSHYPPISPAPIAPSPVQYIAPRPPSPGPAYQVWSATPAEAKAKKKLHAITDDKSPSSETVPRTIRSTPSSEPDARQTGGSNTDSYHDWRERASAREPFRGVPSPASRDTTLPPILQPSRSPQAPLEGAQRPREPPTATTLEQQTRPGGNTATVN